MGICQADPFVADYCNKSQQGLMIDPLQPDEGWWGTYITMNLAVTAANGAVYVTTPQDISRLIALDVCDRAIPIRNGFYEYLKFGTGKEPKTCRGLGCGATLQAFERDNVPTLAPLLGTSTVRVYPSDNRDVGKVVLLQGKDANGITILTTDPGTGLTAPGEYIPLAFPFVDSVYEYSEITGTQKDQTYGPVQIVQVNPTTGVESPLSAMEPNESTGWYRRYLVNGIPSRNLCCNTGGGSNSITISAKGAVELTPVQNETDYLTLPNIPALLEESQSLRYSLMDNGGSNMALHHQRAIGYLNGQLDKYEGKTNVAIRMPLFGSQRMRPSFR